MTSFRWAVCLSLTSQWLLAVPAFAVERGFVENAKARNQALLVGVSHGLPGIDIDVDNLAAMTNETINGFTGKTLMEDEGTVAGIASALTETAAQTGAGGTMLFYFSGHGNVGVLLADDSTIHIQKIKESIVAGRSGLGPLDRLVMIFDSCYSGSLLDPVRDYFSLPDFKDDATASRAQAEAIVAEMMGGRDTEAYWKKLWVFASSRADQTSLAGQNGSVFTNAFKKAYVEAIQQNSTIGEFIAATQKYTLGHNPVARLVPTSLSSEKMRP